MNEIELDKYLHEYETEGIGLLLYSLIIAIIRQTVPRYPPTIYAPNKIWDEDAFLELAHDFTLKKLLQSGRLEHHLLTQETVAGLKRVMRRDFKHFLINNKRGTEASNLFERTRLILHSNLEFVLCKEYSRASNETWGLAGWQNKKLAERLDEVVRAMFEVKLPPLVYYRSDSVKYSHIISNPNLEQLLKTTLQKLDKCTDLKLLMDGLRHRLNLFENTVYSLDEPLKLGDDSENIVYGDVIADLSDALSEVEAVSVAKELFQQLSDRQRAVLALRLSTSNPTWEQISRWLNVPRSTVHKDLDNITQLLRASNLSQDEADQALSELSRLSSNYLMQLGSDLTKWL